MAILIVDDEALIRWSVAETLEASGYEVIEAATAGEALGHIQSGRDIGLVILDLKLPDSSDLSVLRRILELSPRCRVILITAHGTADVFEEARSSGAYEAVSKPFDLQRMAALVHDALAA
jgi:DNA-binding NtrC family response regulator